VSSATVRNDMAVLEQEGYLLQPHTSAGRVPTEKGYRFFVDALGGPGRLAAPQTQQVRSFFARAHGEIETMLHDTTRLLSDLTQYAALATGPPSETAVIRSVQLVGLAPRVVLFVAVLSTGAVEKHTLELNDEVGDERLAAATAHLASLLVGRPLSDLNHVGVPTGDPATDALVDLARTTIARRDADQSESIFVGGTARMASAFEAVDTVRQVLGLLEQQFVVVGLLRDLLDRGLHVSSRRTPSKAIARGRSRCSGPPA
jgi:heat-inducible transcriptional repressor